MAEQEQQILRICGADVPGNSAIYPGLTRIKGISWSIANAICHTLKIDKKKKVSKLTEEELKKITSFFQNPKLPSWLLNRRKDKETGTDIHLITTDLDLKKEGDIRNMKKIRCYKGIRHAMGQPVRGQRTRSHFRAKKRAKIKTVKKPDTTGKT